MVQAKVSAALMVLTTSLPLPPPAVHHQLGPRLIALSLTLQAGMHSRVHYSVSSSSACSR
jgi:hypothetical protein